MDRKIAHNLMTANSPMGRAYRNYLLDGLSDEQIMKILKEAPNHPVKPEKRKSNVKKKVVKVKQT
ncbi:hypothetical protein O9H85_08275 [Paenibacillus filicis]|uniref:Uncharacterized protein n=1 Tax=Paenibacillus gyeongsangnamensis TaxID=3388067 RepID=A0ABT4Q6H7_9BACL|nr:hypothetical protein [Paenibacillus filicis]MCZ8512429.1 hypothetical protein [Paenibacillus filicis]